MVSMFYKPQPPSDPHETLTGRCGTCSTTILCELWQAQPPAQGGAVGYEPNTFGDLWYIGCPGCKARIYLVPCRPPEGA